MKFYDMQKKMKKDGSDASEVINNDIREEAQQENELQPNENTNVEDVKSEIEELSSEEKLKEEIAHLNDRFIRLYAEFDNYKRRTSKERIELLQTAGKDVIISLLPVLDDFERAEKATANATDIAAVKEGISLINNKLKGILSQKGLKEMETIGSVFDADFQEAVTNIPAPSDDLKGKVVDELEKGYLLNDKVIRFAKVVVGA
jgi:molecular chaperone GrpE